MKILYIIAVKVLILIFCFSNLDNDANSNIWLIMIDLGKTHFIKILQINKNKNTYHRTRIVESVGDGATISHGRMAFL